MAPSAEGRTAVNNKKDILLVVDYHAQNCEIRRFNCVSGQERREKIPTDPATILAVVEEAAGEAARDGLGGRVRWIMESTTGWARVKDLIGERAEFVLANVLKIPREPKAHRRKTDKTDTARMLREELIGKLPRSYQPPCRWRQLRRLVDTRWSLTRRLTAVKNWISSYLHHETWADRSGLWSQSGLRCLRALSLPASDRWVMDVKLDELEHLQSLRGRVDARMQRVYDHWPVARRLGEVRGVGMLTAVSVLAHIGPIQRFRNAEALIAYAGLAPALRESDQRRRDGRIGGGGTDRYLRYLLIESSTWLQQIPRYRATYLRVAQKRGKKVARIAVARLFLRSLYKMLTDGLRFNPAVGTRMVPA